MALIPSIFDGRRSNVFDPFSLDIWDPFEGFPFSNSLANLPSSARDTSAFANTRIDWKETPQAHIFKADLPGINKEEVKVEVEEGRVLQISGERSKEQEEKNDKWHRVERSSGKFMRRFRLPENAKVEEVKARMENGVLTVTVPKMEEKKPEIKSIDISGLEAMCTVAVLLQKINERDIVEISDERDTVVYFFDFQEIKESPRKIQKLVVDFLMPWHDAPSASLKACSWKDLHGLMRKPCPGTHLHPIEWQPFGKGTIVHVLFVSIAESSAFIASRQCSYGYNGSFEGMAEVSMLWWIVGLLLGKMFSWNITSRETKKVFLSMFYNLYPFIPGGYPTKIEGIEQGSNFIRGAIDEEYSCQNTFSPKTDSDVLEDNHEFCSSDPWCGQINCKGSLVVWGMGIALYSISCITEEKAFEIVGSGSIRRLIILYESDILEVCSCVGIFLEGGVVRFGEEVGYEDDAHGL
ncbi:17.8 kDa class I heat shock protein-like [Cucumis melo var. makuwa]|uniref:17.8 kDa class I heat shock protein-like n=2 Tax=Cucumis melo TaxID=3656 RepID=A0A5A7UDK4_CUCMM|nr:17.8 kDa class I heat shock protein-like [Cucumis melo var. makuwa]